MSLTIASIFPFLGGMVFQELAPVFPSPAIPDIQHSIDWQNFIDITNDEVRHLLDIMPSMSFVSSVNYNIMFLDSLTEDEDTPLIEPYPIPTPFLFSTTSYFNKQGVATSNREIALSFLYCMLAAHALNNTLKLNMMAADFTPELKKAYSLFRYAQHINSAPLDSQHVHHMLYQHYEHVFSVYFELLHWKCLSCKPPATATIEQLCLLMEILSRIHHSLVSFLQYHAKESPWNLWCKRMISWTKTAYAIILAASLYHEVKKREMSCTDTHNKLSEIVSLNETFKMEGLKNWDTTTNPAKDLRTHYHFDNRGYKPFMVQRITSGDAFVDHFRPDQQMIVKLEALPVVSPALLIDDYRRFKWTK